MEHIEDLRKDLGKHNVESLTGVLDFCGHCLDKIKHAKEYGLTPEQVNMCYNNLEEGRQTALRSLKHFKETYETNATQGKALKRLERVMEGLAPERLTQRRVGRDWHNMKALKLPKDFHQGMRPKPQIMRRYR